MATKRRLSTRADVEFKKNIRIRIRRQKQPHVGPPDDLRAGAVIDECDVASAEERLDSTRKITWILTKLTDRRTSRASPHSELSGWRTLTSVLQTVFVGRKRREIQSATRRVARGFTLRAISLDTPDETLRYVGECGIRGFGERDKTAPRDVPHLAPCASAIRILTNPRRARVQFGAEEGPSLRAPFHGIRIAHPCR